MAAPSTGLASILPPGAVGVECDEAEADPRYVDELRPEERRAIAGASPGRAREFAGGRACARRALAALGVAPAALPVADDGAPVWPAGVVGSITHKGSFRAAAVAFAHVLGGLGIDAELAEPLPAGVLETISSGGELDAVERLLAQRPGTPWDRLLFSAKEASVKAFHSYGAPSHGPREVEVRFDDSARTYEARAGGGAVSARGAWIARGSVLRTVSAVYPPS